MHKAISLEDCSRDELIYFIKRCCFYRLDDLEFEVLMFRSEEARKKSREEFNKADSALSEYIQLLKAYDGSKLTEIPDVVLKKASDAFSRYEKYTKKSRVYDDQYSKIQKQVDACLEKERGA